VTVRSFRVYDRLTDVEEALAAATPGLP